MKKIKVFWGPAASGKSKKAKEIAKGKNTFFIQARDRKINHPFLLDGLTPEHELIIVDDIKPKELVDVIYRLNPGGPDTSIQVNQKYKSAISVLPPETIITMCCNTDPLKDAGSSIEARAESIYVNNFPDS